MAPGLKEMQKWIKQRWMYIWEHWIQYNTVSASFCILLHYSLEDFIDAIIQLMNRGEVNLSTLFIQNTSIACEDGMDNGRDCGVSFDFEEVTIATYRSNRKSKHEWMDTSFQSE